MRLVLVLGSILGASALVGGCFIFTGGTDGYQLVDGGGGPEAGAACSADTTCVALACVSSSDCDAGEVCCVTASGISSLSSLSSTCQVGPCAQIQLCGTNTECGDSGTTCTSQQCPVGGVSLTLESCGAIPGCTP